MSHELKSFLICFVPFEINITNYQIYFLLFLLFLSFQLQNYILLGLNPLMCCGGPHHPIPMLLVHITKILQCAPNPTLNLSEKKYSNWETIVNFENFVIWLNKDAYFKSVTGLKAQIIFQSKIANQSSLISKSQ